MLTLSEINKVDSLTRYHIVVTEKPQQREELAVLAPRMSSLAWKANGAHYVSMGNLDYMFYLFIAQLPGIKSLVCTVGHPVLLVLKGLEFIYANFKPVGFVTKTSLKPGSFITKTSRGRGQKSCTTSTVSYLTAERSLLLQSHPSRIFI